MPIIRKIEIANFRCLKKFSWEPSAGVNCIIGPGDSGKSSIGTSSENHLSWRRGSILNRISEERAETSTALIAAAREMRNTFGEQAKEELSDALQVVAETANELGIPIGNEVKALLDAHSVSISGGTISLHDENGVPLKGLALGSSRLLIAGLQRRASKNASVAIVDELEYSQVMAHGPTLCASYGRFWGVVLMIFAIAKARRSPLGYVTVFTLLAGTAYHWFIK